MIYDTLNNLPNYLGVSDNLDTVIEYIMARDITTLPAGRTRIDGEKAVVTVSTVTPLTSDKALFQRHDSHITLETDLDGSWRPYRAVGCQACNNGYKGRVGLYQVMPITESIQRIILAEGTSMDIATQAQKDGVRDLRQSGLVKVRSGATTLEEVISVTNE